MTASALSSISASSNRKRQASSKGRRRDKISLAGPVLGRDAAIVVAHRVVPCPFDGRPLGVDVNSRVDVLAREKARGHITEAMFLVGRMIQAVFERGSGARLGSAGWDVSGSRDQTIAHELAIIFAIEDASRVRQFSDKMAEAIGSYGVRFLRAILVEGHTFGSYSAATGKGSTGRGQEYVADRFRSLLEALTMEQHTAIGAGGQRIRGTRDPA